MGRDDLSLHEDLHRSRERTMSVVRRVLEQHRRSDTGEIPAVLIEAVALGQGDREAVRQVEGQALSLEKPMDLVLFDTDRISGFVFESSRPPVIRGASKILEELNAAIEQHYSDHVLFSGGGEGLLLVPAGKGERIAREIRIRFRRESAEALSVTTAYLTVAPHEFVAAGSAEDRADEGTRLVTGTQAVLARIRDDIRRSKDSRVPRRGAVSGGRERCVSCRDREGTLPVAAVRPDVEQGMLCRPCMKRWRVGRRLIDGTSFEDIVGLFAEALGQTGEGSKAKDLGFLYADGNAMGALFGKISSLSELRFLSYAVRQLFEDARSRVRERVRQLVGESIEERQPLVSLLAGGDEAIWILPAAVAVELAEALPGWIDEGVAEIPHLLEILSREGRPKLTLGMGLLVCDHSYPVRYQYELAKALQASAKRLYYEAAPGERASAVDFEVLSDSSPWSEDLDDARRVAYRTEDESFVLSCRPYRSQELSLLRGSLRAAAQEGVARSQLYGLQRGATEGRRIFLNYLRYQVGRKGAAADRYQSWLMRMGVDVADPTAIEGYFVRPVKMAGLPAGAHGTWITDAIQLAPYLELLEAAEEESDAAA